MQSNYAFIDSQNVHLGVRDQGWLLDWHRFRVYLREKYDVEQAYVFIGYRQSNESLYTALQKAGYILIILPILTSCGIKSAHQKKEAFPRDETLRTASHRDTESIGGHMVVVQRKPPDLYPCIMAIYSQLASLQKSYDLLVSLNERVESVSDSFLLPVRYEKSIPISAFRFIRDAQVMKWLNFGELVAHG